MRTLIIFPPTQIYICSMRSRVRTSALACISVLLLLQSKLTLADSYLMPDGDQTSVVGEVRKTNAHQEDTLLDVARRFDFGYEEIIHANAGVDRWTPGEGTEVLLPGKYILPDAPRRGIVINLAELRLYYYPTPEWGIASKVHTYPISIGRMDWKSPLGTTQIAVKERDPAWYPTASIRAEHAAEGEYLQQFIPGGDPNNPLGHYALRLALPHYLIHGTDERKEYGIGMRVTHGCIRMYPEDIEELFRFVAVNTPVTFVDQPVKAGWQDAKLFLEVHAPLRENEDEFEKYSHRVTLEEVNLVLAEAMKTALKLNSRKIDEVVSLANGIPTSIATTPSGLPPALRER